MFDTLCYVGKKLNEAGIIWGIGASILLNKYGFVHKPNDIDIFVKLEDIERADEILKNIGKKKKWEKDSTYSTKYFYEYVVNDIEIDVMAGLAINHSNGVFSYVFDQNSISEYEWINGVSIPFTALEDWYVIYQLIPHRESKVEMIEKYLILNGFRKQELIERALQGCLPSEVRIKIEELLRKVH